MSLHHLKKPELVYWYAPKAPKPITAAQATGWHSPLSATESPGACLWRAEKGMPLTARHLSETATHELLARLAITALGDVPTGRIAGLRPRDTVAAIREACHAMAHYDARFTIDENHDRTFNLARHAHWSRYDRILTKQVTELFNASESDTNLLARLTRRAG